MPYVRTIPWENVGVGMPVRWATPRFIIYGIVADIADEMMIIYYEDDHVVIPEAKWYFDQAHDAEEHLVILSDRSLIDRGKVLTNDPKAGQSG